MNQNSNVVSNSNLSDVNMKQSSSDKFRNNKRRRDDLTCVICHGPASGYNFTQISCHSCKEFFRRTALVPIEKTKCLNKVSRLNNTQCEIQFDMKQKCQRCRLVKCFELGMQKDHLTTSEEKFSKQQRIEANRRLRFRQNDQGESRCEPIGILTDTDRVCLSHIANAYLSGIRSIPSTSSLIQFNPSFHQTFSYMHLTEIEKFIPIKLIKFLRSIQEFQSLCEEDRLSLVKYNFIPVLLLRDVLVYDSKNGLFYDDDVGSTSRSARDERFAHNFTSLCTLFYGYDQNQHYTSHLSSLQTIIDNDSLVIQMLMLVLIFLKGASINHEQAWVLFDPSSVFSAHLKYIDLLFRYLIDRYSFDQAVIKMLKIVEQIFKLQADARFYQEKFKNEGDHLEIHPLIRALIS